MKMRLIGYNHREKTHDLTVIPDIPDRKGLLMWDGPLHAKGKLKDLALNGSYTVEFIFEQEELRYWLQEFVEAKPEEAIRLLAEMQAEAILALNKPRSSSKE
jgi:hypothetical protein